MNANYNILDQTNVTHEIGPPPQPFKQQGLPMQGRLPLPRTSYPRGVGNTREPLHLGDVVEIMPWEGIALGHKAPLFAIGVRRRFI